ncbi:MULTISPECIES: phosphatidylserine decarboxylase [Clostridium]|uniref:Phosphatidylserine decarboxylase proenzyme n=1 Tax=Clostridium beijerinckii TaxID=1520 RepID=A0A1S9MZ91_CLOBE|nr:MULTISPECIES: phosphatidylserine decarboxylase [Clostridium]MBN7574454.1 phosphatidylserine decarboxylase [Clostridium beijerinckii]MBN7579508.1 phosphatidylserine decarboxylase [Clostridium beijerinckii]MBN7584305.1 phosphatidylserine decarboxylase [Clostridium beijerinckii]MZK50854.1 phosphatidylserine decarboxylase [Clostridium beijerinckii]MZK59058.1 phosphatidylserine decarboxylase [Clostridium beijerinckii]
MIQVYNRTTKSYEEELIAGKKYIEWTYESPVGKTITELIAKKKLFSKLYGKYCDTKLSKSKISPFVNSFNIDMTMSKKKINEFNSFNDFFTRELNFDARPITSDNNILISPGDGRITAYEDIDLDNIIQIKGLTYSLKELINDDNVASKYKNGICVVLRLCPTDYHRFHFIDSGIPYENHHIKGHYYSVNPIALKSVPKLFCENKREWSLFKSDNFKDVLHIEVGATCVGSIIQTYSPRVRVKKGDEKGYFKFGGSTTILFFEQGSIEIDADIIEQSKLGFECKVLFGENIGTKIL